MRKHLLITSALLLLYTALPHSSSTALPPAPEAQATAVPGPQFHVDTRRREDKPVRLTASDGTGLELTSYEAKAVVDGPLAFTELHLTFKNPQDRVLEGRFEVVLPERAALSRMAMKNANGWQEAEVVELQKARRAYEDFLHRRQDPALMEKQAGNQFQARVFPIPANGEKELIISYSQELTSQQAYMLPLGGLPQVRHLSVEATVWMGPDKAEQKLSYTLNDEAPRGDLTIPRSSPVKGLVHGNLALVCVTPQSKDASGELQDLMVLVDTSASRGAGYGAQLDKLQSLLTTLAQTRPQSKVQIAAFDQEVVPVYNGSLKDCGKAFDKLRKRRPLGATDLNHALHWAGQQKGFKRLLVVTDGVTTSGEKIAAVPGVNRVDVMLVGGIRDGEALQDLVYHKQSESGLVLNGDGDAAELSRSMLRRPASGVKVTVAGAEWVWPEVLDGVEPGQERLIYAKMKSPVQELDVSLQSTASVAARGGAGAHEQNLHIPLTSVNWPLLQRASVAAQLSSLNQQRLRLKGLDGQEVARKMVALSTENRVVCDLTGLLVLETDADYARFGIDRTALSDVMVVGTRGVEMLHRDKAVVVVREHAKPIGANKMKKAAAVPSNGNRASGGQATGLTTGQPADATAAPISESKDSDKSDGMLAGKAGETEDLKQEQDRNAGPRERQNEARPVESSMPRADSAPTARPAAPPAPRTAPLANVDEHRRETTTTRRTPPRQQPQPEPTNEEEGKGAAALTGQMQEIDNLLKDGRKAQALEQALRWQAKEPGDVLALVALGQAYAALGQTTEAARAYGSIIDLYPGRADLRRFAGCRLEALAGGNKLAADSYAKALEQRPDHPSSYRMRAFALLRLGKLHDAFDVLEQGTRQKWPDGRFAGCAQILREDLALVGAAWAAKEPARRPEISKRLEAADASWEDGPSTRFVLSWETDANDVDFHIRDSKGGHAFYSNPGLPSGGRLYADVTTGYGPECFTIHGKPTAGPYKIFIHYYSRGPMGYGMGNVEIVRHDGHGTLTFEERPYLVMNDHAYVDLGLIK